MNNYKENTKYVAVNKTTKHMVTVLVGTPGFRYTEREFADKYIQYGIEQETNLLKKIEKGEVNEK